MFRRRGKHTGSRKKKLVIIGVVVVGLLARHV